MAAAMILRRQLGSSLVDGSARAGLGGSLLTRRSVPPSLVDGSARAGLGGSVLTRRSGAVLPPSPGFLIGPSRPGLGGSIGAYMAKRARVAAASYVTAGSRGIARLDSGAALLKHRVLVGPPRAGMLVPVRAFSDRTNKGALISFVTKYFGILIAKFSKCIESLIRFIVKYFGVWTTKWQNFCLNRRVDLVFLIVLGEAFMVVFNIWKDRWLLWVKIYGVVSLIGSGLAVAYSLNMTPMEFLGLLEYLHVVKSDELKSLVVAFRKHKKIAEGAVDSDIEDNPEMVIMDAYFAAVAAWRNAIAAAKTMGRVDAILDQKKNE